MDRLDPRMIAVYRRMRPEERVEAGLAATEMIRERLRVEERQIQGRVRRALLTDLRAYFSPPEALILKKLEYFRAGSSEKHLRDIRSMLAISPGEIDLPKLLELVGFAPGSCGNQRLLPTVRKRHGAATVQPARDRKHHRPVAMKMRSLIGSRLDSVERTLLVRHMGGCVRRGRVEKTSPEDH